MRRWHCPRLLFFSALLLWTVQASAQSRSICGCAFVSDLQPANVRILFQGDLQPVVAAAGAVVHLGDLIKVQAPVSGTLICDNVSEKVSLVATPRNQPVPCHSVPKEGILIGRNGRVIEGPTMGDIGFAFPMILAPRSSILMDPKPILAWSSIPDAKTYKITIRGAQESWSVNVDAAPGKAIQEIPYPKTCDSQQSEQCAPVLKSGESYKLIVEAKGRSSEEEGLPGLGFSLVSPDKIEKLQARATNINHLEVDASLKVKMLASLYANNGLNSEAIQLLEKDRGSQSNPDAVRLLGDLYLTISLTRRAESAYLKLLEPSLANRDTRFGQALTRQTLGEIYESLGNKPEAIKYYQDAKSIFQTLGERESLDTIKNRLNALQPH